MFITMERLEQERDECRNWQQQRLSRSGCSRELRPRGTPSTITIMARRAPLRGPLTITRGTRPALQETHGTIIIRGMGTGTTIRLITTTADHRFRPPRRIGTPTSPSARIPTMPVRRPAVTAAPSLDYR